MEEGGRCARAPQCSRRGPGLAGELGWGGFGAISDPGTCTSMVAAPGGRTVRCARAARALCEK